MSCSASKSTGASSIAQNSSLPRLAIVFDDVGAQSALGREAKRGAMMALNCDEPTDASGSFAVQGAGVTALFANDTTASDAARDAVLAVGFTDSDELREALPSFAAAGTSIIVAGATDPCLLRLPGGEHLRFACYSDPAQAAAMAEFAFDRLSARTVTVLFDARSEFARAVGIAFSTRFRALEKTTIATEAFAGDYRDPFTKVAHSNPDAVYLAALPSDAPRAVAMLRAQGYRGVILGPDSFDGIELNAQKDEGRIFFSTHAFLAARGESATESFVARYRAKYGTMPTGFAALGYDATCMALAAIAAAQSHGAVTRESIARAVELLGPTEGLSGTIAFAPGERFATKPVWIVEVRQAEQSLAARWGPARIPAAQCDDAH